MDWANFRFTYSLDVRNLRPRMLVIEGYKEAALTPVLPLWWRAQSREIESTGARDNLLEAELARPLGLQTKMAKEELRIRKVRAARTWVRGRFSPGGPPFCLNDILTAHRMVTAGYASAGTLRTSPVEVGRLGVGGIHQGAPPEKLPVLVQDYIQFVNSEATLVRHPVVHALSAHFFFVTLHPFSDGNGRVSRLLQAGILFQHGYNVHGGYGLSDFFYENRDRYETILYQCMQRCPFDLTPFVAFGMEGLIIELQSINTFLEAELRRPVRRGKP